MCNVSSSPSSLNNPVGGIVNDGLAVIDLQARRGGNANRQESAHEAAVAVEPTHTYSTLKADNNRTPTGVRVGSGQRTGHIGLCTAGSRTMHQVRARPQRSLAFIGDKAMNAGNAYYDPCGDTKPILRKVSAV